MPAIRKRINRANPQRQWIKNKTTHRAKNPHGLPVFALFSATRGAIALRGAEGAALAVTAKSLAALNQIPVEAREPAIRERFLVLARGVNQLLLAQGFELIELARVIDRFAMGTPEMAGPLMALSGRAPPPLAAAILRVLTQIADAGNGTYFAGDPTTINQVYLEIASQFGGSRGLGR